MSAYNTHVEMLTLVAQALEPVLCEQMTFVGGCTTGLLLTDAFTREQVRHTDDVDLIVRVIGRGGFPKLQKQLRTKGFKDAAIESAETTPICAMMLGGLRAASCPRSL